LDSAGSVLYGSTWRNEQDGTFTSVDARKRYSPLDLYLMGFFNAAEVPKMMLLSPGASVTYQATDLPPLDGTRIAASAGQVGIDDVVAALGPRSPAAFGAQHDFRAAFVLLVPAGTTATAGQLAFVEAARNTWSNQFFFLTRGRGLMETELVEVPPGTVSSNPSVASGL